MNILRVIASMDPKSGGPCQGIRNSVPALEKMGIQNEVVCFDSPNATFIDKDAFKIHFLGPTFGPYSYCPKLKKWLKQNINRFDIIIIHGVWLYNSYGTYTFWKGLKNKKKKYPRLYLMAHGMLDPYFQQASGRKFKALRNLLFWQLIERKVINGVDGLLFTCEEEMLLARKNFKPYLPRKELNVGYGIKAPPIERDIFRIKFHQKLPLLMNNIYWLFMGRIDPKKGIDLLVKAYLKLKKKYTHIPHLVIAGPGQESKYGNQLKSSISDKQIHFTGMLQGEHKWAALYGCETFILPSHQENFGIAVVEAMACAKPVLISNKVNIWREIENGNGGFVYEDNIVGLYESLEKYLNLSSKEKVVLGMNALQLFKKQFTVEKATKKMMASLRQN